ncbi:MAG: tRNA (N6-isopentenyl adenosine(37)-C2)-methylthiotransferase MiaB [Acidobacteria bacterium]|nr:tRNA (N6-isopentenyl adenosine(37)-C2)-methylthiotransferase MiaB [Acidobacteriota bacterium]
MSSSPDPKTYYIETWGCQMNDLDTQRLSGQLTLRGFRRASSEHDADLILLNTCSVREKSEQKMFSELGRLRAAKERGARIGVCGCVAQQEGEAILARAPYVDFVMGPGNVGYLDDVLEGRARVAVEFPDDRRYDWIAIDRPSAVRAQVTIIEGCNKNCTFCIVPTTRGREVSRPMRDILAEVAHAISTGRVEIELLGQTVNAYVCPESSADFSDLLSGVARVAGVARLRFMTSHPSEVTPRMVAAMRANANICRYIHLPVQSGSSSVLRRMKRLYNREKFLSIVAMMREEIPTIRFSTDVIVGFPGESDEDFEQTLSLLEEVRFGSIYAFKYSERPGTASLRLGAPVDDELSTARLNRLFELQARIERETLLAYEGCVVPVLYEGPSRHDPSVASGKSEDNWTVNFHCQDVPAVGTLVDVHVIGAKHHSLFGKAVS